VPSASLKQVILEIYCEEITEAKQKLLSCFSDLETYGLTGFVKRAPTYHEIGQIWLLFTMTWRA